MEVHEAKMDISKLKLKQFGSLIQVTGLEDEDMRDSSSASISLFDEVAVSRNLHRNICSWSPGVNSL